MENRAALEALPVFLFVDQSSDLCRRMLLIMQTVSSWSLALVLVAAPLSAGCGGGLSSGVDGSKQGDELSNDETAKVCQAIVNYGSTVFTKDDGCKAAGVLAGALSFALSSSDATIQSACNDGLNNCKKNAPADADPGNSCDVAKADPLCTATVADVEKCATERLDAAASTIDKIPSCGQLSQAYFKDPPKEQQPATIVSAACENTDSKCASAAALIAGSTLK